MPQGITAQFNLNVLEVLNRGAGRGLPAGPLRAPSRSGARRTNGSRCDCARWCHSGSEIQDLDLEIELKADEEIRTEISAKFRREGLLSECAAAGFKGRGWWTDERDWFALSLWEAV